MCMCMSQKPFNLRSPLLHLEALMVIIVCVCAAVGEHSLSQWTNYGRQLQMLLMCLSLSLSFTHCLTNWDKFNLVSSSNSCCHFLSVQRQTWLWLYSHAKSYFQFITFLHRTESFLFNEVILNSPLIFVREELVYIFLMKFVCLSNSNSGQENSDKE